MKKIFVYSGTGSYQSKDVENFLSVFDMDYRRICEHNFKDLKNKDIFIVPGGQVSAYLPAWGIKNKNIVKNFVKRGGAYIGICSGSYIAGKKFEEHEGLGFFKETLLHTWHQSIIKTLNKKNEIIELIAENGPDLSQLKIGKKLLTDKFGKPQAIKIKFGKGQVYLFSSHPEGSIYYNKHPRKFSGALYFLSFLKKMQ